MLCFVDTNIFIYWLQHSDAKDPDWHSKHSVCEALIHRLAAQNQIVISTQVLNEFINAVARKGTPPLSWDETGTAVELLSTFPTFTVEAIEIKAALARAGRYQISYFDALIVEAALRAGCSILYTEDLHHGMRFDALEVRNPFKS